MDARVGGLTDGEMDRRTVGRTIKRTNGHTDKETWKDGRTDGKIDRRTIGRTDGDTQRIEESFNKSCCIRREKLEILYIKRKLSKCNIKSYVSKLTKPTVMKG